MSDPIMKLKATDVTGNTSQALSSPLLRKRSLTSGSPASPASPMWTRLSRTQTIESIISESDEYDGTTKKDGLKKELRVIDLIAYGLGSTVGAGIFVTSGVAAHDFAGPGVVLSFALASFVCLLSALPYAEFAARVPVSGSAYTFAYTSLGEGVAWFIGWNLTLEYGISASAVARGWADYVTNLFVALNYPLPDWVSKINLGNDYYGSPLAAFIIVFCTLVLLMGVKESARFNLVMTFVNMLVIGFIIIVGGLHVDPSNWQPFLPFGLPGVISASGVVFFSYVGFDAVSTLSEEVKNPQRDLPLGILGTLGVSSLLYIAVTLVLTGLVSQSEIDVKAPLSQAFLQLHLTWAGTVIAFGSVTTLTATTLCSLFGQPRIYYRMAKDGLLWPVFGRLNKNMVPVWGTVITGVVSSIIAFFLDISSLTSMISIGTLLAFTVVCASVVVQRYDASKVYGGTVAPLGVFALLSIALNMITRYCDGPLLYSLAPLVGILLLGLVYRISLFPRTATPSNSFLCPLVPLLPCMGMLANIYLILSLPIDAIYRIIVWTFVGFTIYFCYGAKHSKLERNFGNGNLLGEESGEVTFEKYSAAEEEGGENPRKSY